MLAGRTTCTCETGISHLEIKHYESHMGMLDRGSHLEAVQQQGVRMHFKLTMNMQAGVGDKTGLHMCVTETHRIRNTPLSVAALLVRYCTNT